MEGTGAGDSRLLWGRAECVINGTFHCLEEQILMAKQMAQDPANCFRGRQCPVEPMRTQCSGYREPSLTLPLKGVGLRFGHCNLWPPFPLPLSGGWWWPAGREGSSLQ